MNFLKAFGLSLLLLLVGCNSTPPDRMIDQDYESKYEYMSISEPENGSIFSSNSNINFYGEDYARRVGDVITVTLSENMSASKNSSANSAKSSEASVTPLSLLGNIVTTGALGGTDLSASMGSDNSYSGSGAASQSNKVNGVISVTVHKVLPNGNLFVKGEKWISINTGEEFVQLSGIVRQQDISNGNTVDSTKLADARIVYSGKGHLKNSSEPGLLFKFFNSQWWPF
jgi:flagellar L-ring protein precursor FlgH